MKLVAWLVVGVIATWTSSLASLNSWRALEPVAPAISATLPTNECMGDCIFAQVPNQCPDNCVATMTSCQATSLENCDGCAVVLKYSLVCDTGSFFGELNHLGNCQSGTNRIVITCPSHPEIKIADMEAVCLECN